MNSNFQLAYQHTKFNGHTLTAASFFIHLRSLNVRHFRRFEIEKYIAQAIVNVMNPH
jgi:hypothetical protein